MVWFRSFGEKKFSVKPQKGYRDPNITNFWGYIESPRFARPKIFNFGKDKNYAIKYMNEQLGYEMENKKRIYEDRMKRKQYVSNIKKGDIFHSSWGYDQTNNDYFQVTKAKGKSIWLRGIQARSAGDSSVMPIKNAFLSSGHYKDNKEIRRLVRKGDYVSIDNVRIASKWSGESNYETPFGMGH